MERLRARLEPLRQLVEAVPLAAELETIAAALGELEREASGSAARARSQCDVLSTSPAPAMRVDADGPHALTLPPGFTAMLAATFVDRP